MTSFLKKFKNALAGIIEAFQGLSFVIQSTIGAIIVFSAFYLPISNIERAILFLSIFSVLAFEMVNSSLERLADRLIPEDDAEIKFVKDLAAGAVLVFSVGTVIIGIMILGPHLINLALNIY